MGGWVGGWMGGWVGKWVGSGSDCEIHPPSNGRMAKEGKKSAILTTREV